MSNINVIKTTQVAPIQTTGTIYNKTSGLGNADAGDQGKGPDQILVEKQNQHYGFKSIPPAGVGKVALNFGNCTWSVAENDGIIPNLIFNDQLSGNGMQVGDVSIYNDGTDSDTQSWIWLQGKNRLANMPNPLIKNNAVVMIYAGGATITVSDGGGIFIQTANEGASFIIDSTEATIQMGRELTEDQGPSTSPFATPLATSYFVEAVMAALSTLGHPIIPQPYQPFTTSVLTSQ